LSYNKFITTSKKLKVYVTIWRKLRNEKLHSLYSSSDILRVIKSRRIRWAGRVARMQEGRCVYGVLFGRPEGKNPLERPRHRREDNMKWTLQR
jgi:hypothetical protein